MASSFFALLDDITLLLDDVSVMTKVAAKKTVGVLSDDIALNANQVTGFSASRELPVVWAVAKGSALNKAILVPVALLIVVFVPWALTPLLMVGGAYLCFEGVEKLFHKLTHRPEDDARHHEELKQAVAQSPEELLKLEKDKIRKAVMTDFILSAEIIAISLGTMQAASLSQQAAALVAISILMTVGVYGLVAGIVKLDDLGLYLAATGSAWKTAIGNFILKAAPYLMRALSFAGTAAMFLVGGGIIAHGFPAAEHLIHSATESAAAITPGGAVLAALVPHLGNAVLGIIVGILVLGAVLLVKKMFNRSPAPT